MERIKKWALVGGGGGFKGDFLVGVLMFLHSIGVQLSYFTGISVSALVGALEAQGKFEIVKQLFDEVAKNGPGIIHKSDLLIFEGKKVKLNKKNAWKILLPKMKGWDKVRTVLKLLSEKGREELLKDLLSNVEGIKAVADNTPLLALLLEHVKIKDFQIPFECGFVSLTTGEYVTVCVDQFDSDEELAKAIWASATMPLVWSPVESVRLKDGTVFTNLVDGGLRNNSPTGDAIRYINGRPENEDWTLIVVNHGSGHLDEMTGKLNLLNIGVRSLYDIALSEMFQNDLEVFLETNHRVKSNDAPQFNRAGKPLRDFEAVIIQPDKDELGSTLDASADLMAKRREMGSQAAAKAWGEWLQQAA